MIGRVTETGRLVLRMHGETAAEIPLGPLVTEAPVYRAAVGTARPAAAEIDPSSLPARDPIDRPEKLVACPDLASKRWVWEQYDHLVHGQHGQTAGRRRRGRPASDGGKALAVATDRRRATAAPIPSAAACRRWRKAGAT